MVALGLLVMLVVIIFVGGLVILRVLGVAGAVGQRRYISPENLLRVRYASGEIGRQSYLDALADVLKDRYLRSELTSDEYEEKIAVLLQPPLGERRFPPPSR